MKIGILTFHKAYNYGAFMQCYSLSKAIKEMMPDSTVEVVDYVSNNMLQDYKKSNFKKVFGDKRTNGSKPLLLITKRLIKFLLEQKKNLLKHKYDQNIMNEFEKSWKYLPISQNGLISDSPEDFKQFINRGQYDVLIVGSDAIWNDNQTSSPNVYLLHDIENCIKFSYAPSTYGMDYSNRTAEEKKYLSESFMGFDFIGVRDDVTLDYVTKYTNGNAKPRYTCDPSLILDLDDIDVDNGKIKEKLVEKGVDFSKPIIGLMCSSWLAKNVRANLGEEFQYVSIYHYNGYEDVFLDNLSPFEWSKVFSLFDATFTHYFHGTMFSIKNGTLTFSVEKNTSYKKNYTTKIQDSLHKMDLYNECYYEYEVLDSIVWNEIKVKIVQNNKKTTFDRYQKAIGSQYESFEYFAQKLKEVCENGTKEGA